MTREELERVIHSKTILVSGLKHCSAYEEVGQCWAGCPCVYYEEESEEENDVRQSNKSN